MDFGVPPGTRFSSFFVYFHDLVCQMDGIDASVDFLMIFGWKWSQNWMLGYVKTTVKTDVFLMFHVFHFFYILMSPGGPWDLILKGFGTLGTPFW